MNKRICIVVDYLPPAYGGASIAGYRYFKYRQLVMGNTLLLGNNNAQYISEKDVATIPQFRYNLHRYINFHVNFVLTFFYTFIFFFKTRSKFDIVHCFEAYSNIAFAAGLCALLFRKKLIMESTLMGSDDPNAILMKGDLPWYHYIRKGSYMRRFVYSRADSHVSKSSFMTNSFKNLNGRLSASEIPYFVSTEYYKPAMVQDKRNLRALLGIPADRTIVCFVGGINSRKGVDLLVDACLHLQKTRPDLYLLLVGPYEKYQVEYTQQLVIRIKEIGEAKIKLTGMVSNVHEYMQASDIFVLPSYREGFPISILEALCTGLLVVASSLPEIENVQIEHEVNGLIFAKGSVEDLEKKLEQALQIIKSNPDFVTHVQTQAKHKYDIEEVNKKYEILYSSLIRNN